MKYFKVKNDIIKTDIDGNPSTTDEPLWLRNEIDQWKDRYGQDVGGGRFFATEDARYSYIISPNDDLMDLSNDDLEELTEEEILDIIAIAFPPSRIEREGEPDEIIPTPSLETVCSVYWHYATNHTGTISASESWTLANNDHHITGNITLNANVVLTIDAGVNVYWDGNYTITRTAGSGGTTTITAIGTAALPITFESNASRTNTGVYNAITTGITGANNCATTLQYCNIANFTTFMVASSYTSFTMTLDHLNVRDCSSFIANAGASVVPTTNISNSRFIRCYSSAIGFGTVTSGTSTHTFTDCEWRQCLQVVVGTESGGTINVNFVDCAFLDKTIMSPASGNNMSILHHNFTRCFFDCYYMQWALAVVSYTDCIITRVNSTGLSNNPTSTNSPTVTTTDIMGPGTTNNIYAINNSSTAATAFTFVSCYISGWRGADIFNYYTGTETPAQIVETSNTTLSPAASVAPASNAVYTSSNGVTCTCYTSSTTAPVFTYAGTTNPATGTWNKVSGTGDSSITVSVVANATIPFTTPRTTRNFPFTQSSITVGSITASGATISWTGAFRTMNRLCLGTVSGTYTKVYTKDDSWTDFDGKGKMTASPSFTITGLSSGTTYYYQCESWDWVRQMWVKSTESSFTTSAAAPTFSGISTLTNLGTAAVGVLASWSAATGTTTEYKVYVKKDNATSLFTDTYYKCKVPSTQTSVELYTYADNTTNIANGDLVYVGIRACNSSDCDTNSTSLSVTATAGSAPTFAGITGLEPIGFGALLASWSAATGTKTNYNVYIKIGSAPDFTEKPIKVDTTYTSFKITHLSDGTRIQDTDNVYVSVRAENTPTLIDTNTAVLNLYPIGSGSTGVIVGDTVAISLKQ